MFCGGGGSTQFSVKPKHKEPDPIKITGLSSNPTIFDHVIKNSSEYDAPIREKLRDGESVEPLFLELGA